MTIGINIVGVLSSLFELFKGLGKEQKQNSTAQEKGTLFSGGTCAPSASPRPLRNNTLIKAT